LRPASSRARRAAPVGAAALIVVALGLCLVLGIGFPGRGVLAGNETVRVGLVTDRGRASLGTTGQGILYDSAGSPVTLLGPGTTFTAAPGDLVEVPGVGQLPGPLTVRAIEPDPSSPCYVTVEGHPYRGHLEILARGGVLVVVNVVGLEDYLLGVVPREMPSTFPEEALKAQAVAARTYALYTKTAGTYAHRGYDLVPTTACQVYGGVEAERESTTKAVRDTAGEVITYQGRLIGAYFHSTSGGHTESVEFVWGFPSPYLKGVPDRDQESPHYFWKVSFTAAEVSSRLEQAGYGVGSVWSIEGVAPQGPGGRYLERSVTGSAGQVRLRSERLRSILGLKSAWFEVVGEAEHVENAVRPAALSGLVALAADGTRASLTPGAVFARRDLDLTRLETTEVFTVSPVLVPATLTFEGRGWGHGVGLSQWGARGLALEGKTYREILEYYYTGVTVGTLP